MMIATAVTSATTAANLFLRFIRWQFLLRRLGVRVPAVESLAAFGGSFGFLPIPFYLGQLVARAKLLPRSSRPPAHWIITAFLWERTFDLAALLVLALPALPRPLRTGVVVVLLQPFLWGGARRWLVQSSQRFAWTTARLVSGAAEASEPQFRARAVSEWSWLVVAAISFGAWAATAAGAALVLRPVSAQVNSLYAAGLAARSVLVGALSGVPLGAGIAGLDLLGNLRAAGLPEVQAAAAVFVFRAATVWLTVAIGAVAAVLAARRNAAGRAADHFDEVADCYDAWLPPHYRDHVVGKKTARMLAYLPGERRGLRGLDVGCGRGWYLGSLRQHGLQLLGMDLSAAQVAASRATAGARVPLVRGSVLAIPFRDGTFDFAYTINVLHHIGGPATQQRALAECARVLRRGGVLMVHEMNVLNPLFRFYLAYVFPVLKGIEEGTEHYLDVRALPATPELELVAVEFFTFLPDFTPRRLLPTLARLEERLERSRLRRYAAHFLAVYRRTDAA